MKKGFTLVEVLIAMIILSTGIMLLANSWSGSFMRLRKAKVSTEIAALLERKVTEIELEYKGKSLESIPEEKEDDFGSDYPEYSWKMKSKALEIPDLSAALTSKEGGANEMLLMMVKSLADHLGKTVKEVQVTVLFKGGKKTKPISYSITSYFVDYDKEIQIPGMGGLGGASGGGGAGGGGGGGPKN